MKDLEMIQKLSILHCVYQTIASADGSIEQERDSDAIELALNELELTSIYSWDSALKLNPHDCFSHIFALDESNKQQFKALLNTISGMGGNKLFRTNCANHIVQLCQA
jgi:hypothetical protein